MADSPTIRWRNRPSASLTAEELSEAMEFCQIAYEETRQWAPVAVWACFSTLLADLTVEQAKRTSGASLGQRMGV